jgi:predicted amidohydrolase YtcJ
MLRDSAHSATVFLNGIVRTQEPARPLAEAVVIRGDRITFVGGTAEARSVAGPAAKLVDLGGRLMLPGFIDGHVHFLWGGQHLLGINLRECSSPAHFRETVAAYVSRRGGRWVTGGTWDHEQWPGRGLPTRQLIDDVSGDTPVFVRRIDGHMGLANSLALRLAGITPQTPDPEGGKIDRDPLSGEPTGILKDTAMNLVTAVIPKLSEADLERAAMDAQQAAARKGITSIHDITMSEDLDVYRKLEKDQKLTVRIYTRLPISCFEDLVREGIRAGHGSKFLKTGSLKAFADGSLGSGTAWFFDPYDDDGTSTGLPTDTVTNGQLRARALEADRAGLQLSIHAIGDRANRFVLELAGEIASVNPFWDRRLRIEHAQHVRAADIPSFKASGIIVSAQPYHLADDGVWAESRLGRSRVSTSYSFKSFLDAGVVVCFGSDWTVAPLNVMSGIHAAVTRQTTDGKNPGGWVPEQKLTVDQAVKCYTVHNAFAAFEENEKGSIKAGKLADLVVVDRDVYACVPDAIRDADVDMTIVGGRVVYER